MTESLIKKGLYDDGEFLDKEKIYAGLSKKALSVIGDKLEVFQTIDSTNLEAKRRVAYSGQNLHGAVLLAEHQSAGRGRLGRSFYSPAKKGIYLSLIYNTDEYTKGQTALIDPFCITAITAVAITRALSSFGIESHIKWVNDIFIHKKKVCGILTEGILSTKTAAAKIHTLIVGVGINVFEDTEGFPDELKETAGALDTAISRNKLVLTVLNEIIEKFSGVSPLIELMQEYRNNSLVLGKKVQVITPNEQYLATVLDITDKAHLIIEREDGTQEEILSGEVSLRL